MNAFFKPQKRLRRAPEEGSGTSDTDEGLKVSIKTKCSLKGWFSQGGSQNLNQSHSAIRSNENETDEIGSRLPVSF